MFTLTCTRSLLCGSWNVKLHNDIISCHRVTHLLSGRGDPAGPCGWDLVSFCVFYCPELHQLPCRPSWIISNRNDEMFWIINNGITVNIRKAQEHRYYILLTASHAHHAGRRGHEAFFCLNNPKSWSWKICWRFQLTGWHWKKWAPI